MANVDRLGQAVYHTEQVSLVADGRELDLRVAYDTAIDRQQSLSLQAMYRHDVMHTQGLNDFNIGAMWSRQF